MELTRESILAMDQDEMNIMIAEKIFHARTIGKDDDPTARLLIGVFGKDSLKPMRHTWRTSVWHRSDESAWLDCPRYSEDIAAAWKVVEKFQIVNIEFVEWFEGNKSTRVKISVPIGEDEFKVYEATEKSAPLAICRAALLTTIEE